MVAAGYSNGRINLYHIENADILHSIHLEGEITCMEWVCQFCPEDAEWKPDPYKEDNFRNYLPKLQPLNKRLLSIIMLSESFSWQRPLCILVTKGKENKLRIDETDIQRNLWKLMDDTFFKKM